MSIILNWEDAEERDYKHDCKGLVFRCERSAYKTGTDLVEQTRLRLLKRKSCDHFKTCETCNYWFDVFSEEYDVWRDTGIPCDKGFEHGKLYHPVGRVWQSYEGDYDFEWEFQEYREPQIEPSSKI